MNELLIGFRQSEGGILFSLGIATCPTFSSSSGMYISLKATPYPLLFWIYQHFDDVSNLDHKSGQEPHTVK